MLTYVTCTFLACLALSSAVKLDVASSGGNASSPLMYGIMFEVGDDNFLQDINYSGDGGLYAELIQNRAFQGTSSVSPFTAVGGATLSLRTLPQTLSSALPQSMNVAGGSGTVGFSNPGWWGIDVKVKQYQGSFYVKGSYSGNFTASLSSLSNALLGSVEIPSVGTSSDWNRYNFTLTPTTATASSNNTFKITYNASGVSGSLDFNLISLFPPTYKNRENGMRVDLMEALADLKPSFLRFPGGNNIEGNSAPEYWKWNNTLLSRHTLGKKWKVYTDSKTRENSIGPLANRPGRPGTWGYPNTDGLGLIEFMHWCEDLNMEPILATFSGLYLSETVVSQSDLQPYVDEFMDELEFLMGSTSSINGGLRASLGYPNPWKVKYVEIGNEDNLNNGQTSYSAYRFSAFYNAIKTKYPEITIIASTSGMSLPGNAGQDYHVYNRPNRLAKQFDYFDHFLRSHKTLIGEYANIQQDAMGDPSVDWNATRLTFPWWTGAVSEAVFTIGAERNSDVIIGASYAPLLCNLNSHQWVPDLIAYTADPSQTVLSTSHAVISLLSSVRITNTLPVTGDGFGPGYWVAGLNNNTGSYVLKTAVYNGTGTLPMMVAFAAVSEGALGVLTVLTAPSGTSSNSLGSNVLKTTTQTLTAGTGGVFTFSLPNFSVSILEVKASFAGQ